MNGLCLGFWIPQCDELRSYSENTFDWIPLKVRMKALVGNTAGVEKGGLAKEKIKRWYGDSMRH